MKKVLFYITNPQRMAGSNRALFEVIINLPKEIQSHILFSDKGLAHDFYVQNNLKVDVLKPEGVVLNSYGKKALSLNPIQKAFSFFKEYIPYVLRLHSFLKANNDIDIVHTNDVRSLFLMGPVARLCGKKVILHIHTEYYCPPLLWKLVKHLPHKIITVSNYIKTRLDEKSKLKTTCIYNGIRDITEMSPGAIAHLIDKQNEGKFVVGCFASIIPFKSVHYLVDAAKIIQERGLGESFHFVSIGPDSEEHLEYKNWLYEKVKTSALNNFEFAGWQSEPAKYYRSIDVCVLPSVSKDVLNITGKEVKVQGNEGFPTTNLEAMLFALPVVATRISGTPEQVIDSETGFLVAPANPEELADRLIQLQQMDTFERNQLGVKGRAKVLKEFSLERCVEQFTGVLGSI